jgi:beta-glucanase (GH16 family)
MNLAAGGNWPGNPDSSTQFPQSMIADYVRVYQFKQADSLQKLS